MEALGSPIGYLPTDSVTVRRKAGQFKGHTVAASRTKAVTLAGSREVDVCELHAVERSCAACGVFGASFGFGVFRNRSDGLWSCADTSCQAAVKAMVAAPAQTRAAEQAA
jgi:hypothetical protein